MSYNYKELVEAYESIGVEKGGVIYVSGDLSGLGYYGKKTREEILNEHFQALREGVGEEGTLVFPVHSPSLFHTDMVFDQEETPSETGVLTEFMRQQEGVVRSFHPYFSVAALGPNARDICGKNSRHSYDWNSPYGKMLNFNNCMAVSIGLKPALATSIVHLVELVSGVPYRYTKEFLHPVRRESIVQKEPFYHFVLYRECDVERNKNKKFFEVFENKYRLNHARVGRGKVYAYSQTDFFYSSVELMQSDIFSWLEKPPEIRPFRN